MTKKLMFLIFSLKCIFCEKIFKDRTTLREHMRKKQHKQINPKNPDFDMYYLVNYLEPGKTWEDLDVSLFSYGYIMSLDLLDCFQFRWKTDLMSVGKKNGWKPKKKTLVLFAYFVLLKCVILI